jgi:hypothetical protein
MLSDLLRSFTEALREFRRQFKHRRYVRRIRAEINDPFSS